MYQEICLDVKRQWDVHKIAIGHRIGTVGVSEPSVIIAVSSAHRKASLEVIRWYFSHLSVQCKGQDMS